MDAAAHTGMGGIQQLHGLYPVHHLVLRQVRCHHVGHHLVQMDIPPIENRPAVETRMEVFAAFKPCQPCRNEHISRIRLALLRLDKNKNKIKP